jgi:pimeloyl-ACP methyl ester carboxylesterase
MQHETIGNGLPLVLVPGGLTGWLSWIPHAEALSDSRQVTRVQLQNVALGLAGDRLPPDYSIDYEISALGATLDDLSAPQADFAAWSLGGEVYLSYAIRNPKNVRSLTLIEPPAYWVLRSRGLLSEDVLAEQDFNRSLAVPDVSEDQLIAFMDYAKLIPPGVDIRTMQQWPVWSQHRQSLRMGDAPFRHEDDIDLVRAFDKPVLLVKGDGSNPGLHAIIDVLGEEFPNARIVTFPCGHAPHIVSMQAFMEQFISFLSESS